MKYGCIGEHLKHSFSKEIHNAFAHYEYEICEVAREDLASFICGGNFSAINVTIPYKELVIPHLYEIDENASRIGAVNTVVNSGGRLYGYNTDFYGMTKLIEHAKISLLGKKVAILGTGGTSKTAQAVASSLGARQIIRVSRSEKEGAVSYDKLYEEHSDVDVLINTTPAGMFPNIFDKAVDISRFHSLSGVVDAVYNPLRTELIYDAAVRGIPAEGGLYMLVAQAVRASEIFLDKTYPDETVDSVYAKILCEKENIVLIGMPCSGKSTVGKIIAEKLGRPFIDTDEMIVDEAKMPITEIFSKFGEGYFRDLEEKCIKRASALSSAVIATGGGAILRQDNIPALKKNGRVFFIDRPLESLIPTDSRPLSNDRASIEKRYRERYAIYCDSCDVKIDATKSAAEVANEITEIFMK